MKIIAKSCNFSEFIDNFMYRKVLQTSHNQILSLDTLLYKTDNQINEYNCKEGGNTAIETLLLESL